MSHRRVLMKIKTDLFPYLAKYTNKIVVIKYGGSIMENSIVKKKFIEDVALMQELGLKIVIVHGGGKEINKRFSQLNIKSEFLDGYRITKESDIDEIEMVLSGKINNQLLTSFAQLNIDAVGISGKDMQLIKVIPKKSFHEDKDYGFVGEITHINTKILEMLLSNDVIPIISPLGYDKDFNTYNINADDVASAVCTSLKADKLILLTDVNGLYKEFGNTDSFIKHCNVEELKMMIEDKHLSGAILPKVQSCISSIDAGVKTCHIINGAIEHSILMELFTDEGIGSKITKEDM